MMEQDIYHTTLIVLTSTLTFCGTYLLFGKLHSQLKNSDYKLSRHLMGYAYLVTALAIITYFLADMGNINSKYAIALNISCCYIVSKLLGESFIRLIGRAIKRNRFYKASIYLFPYVVWLSTLIDNSILLDISQVILSLSLLASILIDTKSFFKEYNLAKIHNKYLYEEGTGLHISWMIKIIHKIIYFGIFSAVILLFYNYLPNYILIFYTISFIILTIYVFNRYLLYTTIHKVLKDNIKNNSNVVIDDNTSTLSVETRMQIQNNLSKWIDSKKYCKKEVNIFTVAKDISTNRLYLSKYINTVYKCSFRVWISQLRIDESKKMMSENKDILITEVADRVGFKSLTTFTHTFRAAEGIPPREWMRGNVTV